MKPHGLMLHHFTGGIHPAGQGAITGEQFRSMIDYLGPHNFLEPNEWMERSAKGRLQETDLCVTFDDSLLCQYEIAKPILDDFGLKGFWFVYSSVFEGSIERLELYRHYRTVRFPSVEDFYARFFSEVASSDQFGHALRDTQANFNIEGYLPQFSFYSRNDRLFRYTRDKMLGQKAYFEIMDRIIAGDEDYSPETAAKALWMNDGHLKNLSDEGHIVGMHSYSHPTEMRNLPRSEQLAEYARNHTHLTKVTGQAPRTMSHPCGSYSDETLDILRHDLGVEIGFVATLTSGSGSALEQLRNDHSHVAIEMGIR